jgi:glucan phosphoethanolaminetransferase (alkaline phosphatase superfamily)
MIEERIEPTPTEEATKNSTSGQRGAIIGLVIFILLVVGGIVAAILGLLNPNTPTERIRDIFIIFMAFESLVIGVALVILILQIASLMNLLQNEIKPIMDATNETIHTLRGTTAFLSENMIDPVVKLNANLAGLQRVLELLGIKRK